MLLCVGRNGRSLWNICKWIIPGSWAGCLLITGGFLQVIPPCFYQPWGLGSRDKAEPGLPPLGFVFAQWADDLISAVLLFQKSSPLGSRDPLCFCLSLNLLRLPTLPWFLLDWRIVLEGVKVTPQSAVWISVISSAACRFVGDGTSWDWKVTEFQAEHLWVFEKVWDVSVEFWDAAILIFKAQFLIAVINKAIYQELWMRLFQSMWEW